MCLLVSDKNQRFFKICLLCDTSTTIYSDVSLNYFTEILYMLEKVFIAPSFNTLVVTGLAMLFAFIIFFNNRKSFMNMDHYKQLKLLFLFIIAIGVHGLLHLGLETVYHFNPYNLV